MHSCKAMLYISVATSFEHISCLKTKPSQAEKALPKVRFLAARGHCDATVKKSEERVPVPLVAFLLIPMQRKK